MVAASMSCDHGDALHVSWTKRGVYGPTTTSPCPHLHLRTRPDRPPRAPTRPARPQPQRSAARTRSWPRREPAPSRAGRSAVPDQLVTFVRLNSYRYEPTTQVSAFVRSPGQRTLERSRTGGDGLQKHVRAPALAWVQIPPLPLSTRANARSHLLKGLAFCCQGLSSLPARGTEMSVLLSSSSVPHRQLPGVVLGDRLRSVDTAAGACCAFQRSQRDVFARAGRWG